MNRNLSAFYGVVFFGVAFHANACESFSPGTIVSKSQIKNSVGGLKPTIDKCGENICVTAVAPVYDSNSNDLLHGYVLVMNTSGQVIGVNPYSANDDSNAERKAAVLKIVADEKAKNAEQLEKLNADNAKAPDELQKLREHPGTGPTKIKNARRIRVLESIAGQIKTFEAQKARLEANPFTLNLWRPSSSVASGETADEKAARQLSPFSTDGFYVSLSDKEKHSLVDQLNTTKSSDFMEASQSASHLSDSKLSGAGGSYLTTYNLANDVRDQLHCGFTLNSPGQTKDKGPAHR